MMVIRLLYSLFISVLIALFVGVGIATFYPGPKRPEYPIELSTLPTKEAASPEAREKSIAFEKENRDFQELNKIYARNVSIVSLSAAIIILVISLTLFRRILMIADGLMLGGLFTLVYSIARGFETQDNKYRFIVVTVGLIIALVLGYIKFVKPQEAKK